MAATLINTDLHEYVREIAKLENIPDNHIVDGFNEMGGPEKKRFELFCNGQACDGCHPTNAGYLQLASVVYRHLFFTGDTKAKLMKKSFSETD